ncbi:hypothetical protein YC2023_085910 [Brassica napus]
MQFSENSIDVPISVSSQPSINPFLTQSSCVFDPLLSLEAFNRSLRIHRNRLVVTLLLRIPPLEDDGDQLSSGRVLYSWWSRFSFVSRRHLIYIKKKGANVLTSSSMMKRKRDEVRACCQIDDRGAAYVVPGSRKTVT